MLQKTKPVIAITPGDPDGIGPEITIKALRALSKKYSKSVSFLVVGSKQALKGLPKDCRVLAAPQSTSYFLPGFQSGWSIEVAAKLCLSGEASAMVTGPISKERLQKGGFYFFGHTDMLAAITGTKKVTMVLANDHLRVALVTTHIALSKVPQSLRTESIVETFNQVKSGLIELWGIKKPRIAILSLNPHAGESGLFGNEEKQIISPAIEKTNAEGPFPADTFFAINHLKPKKYRYDAVIGMYHDQVLTPVKLLDFSKTVNITLGLPIIRTSVDHGTAFDIAGKNKANPDSMIAAIETAISFSTRSKKGAKK